MGQDSKIEWTDHTFNPWRGCSKVSDGCKNCYAEALSRRNPAVLGEWGPHGKRAINADWNKPLAWCRKAARQGRRARVFPSLCDWLEDRTDLMELRVRFLRLMYETREGLDWLLLTKRPENFARLLREALDAWPTGPSGRKRDRAYWWASNWLHGKSHKNAWLGVSVENQATADERIPYLLNTPAAVRFLSCEPLLGPVDLEPYLEPAWVAEADPGAPGVYCPGIDWVIVGGESGPGARPMHPDWARSIRDQCIAAGVSYFFKQWGEWLPQSHKPFQPREYAFLNRDGRFQNGAEGICANSGWEGVGRVGKKAAGRSLDGREWNEMPITHEQGAR